jgi:hypothetical protein
MRNDMNDLGPGNILRYGIGGGTPVLVAQTGPSSADYAMTSMSFMASGASTAIDFFFETDFRTGTWKIDDVSVTTAAAAVPAPITLALMGLCLAGVGFSRKRKTT